MKLWDFIGHSIYRLSWPVINLIPIKNLRVRCLVISENEVLLTKDWFGSNRWRLPGGGVKRGETPEETAIRELGEEFALKASEMDAKLIGRLSHRRTKLRLSIPIVLVKLKSKTPDQVRPISRSISYAKWFKLDRLPKGMSEITERAIALLQ